MDQNGAIDSRASGTNGIEVGTNDTKVDTNDTNEEAILTILSNQSQYDAKCSVKA